LGNRVFTIVYLVGLFGAGILRGFYAWPNRRAAVEDDRRTSADTLLLIPASFGLGILPILYAFTPWLDFADYAIPAWAGWIGVVLFVFALWLLWRSHAHLGRNWSPRLQLRPDHRLVTEGMYRYMRHPMYSAHWLWALAQPLLLHNWIAGPALIVTFLPLYVYRAPREEQMMLERFGAGYRDYLKATGRLWPRRSRSCDSDRGARTVESRNSKSEIRNNSEARNRK